MHCGSLVLKPLLEQNATSNFEFEKVLASSVDDSDFFCLLVSLLIEGRNGVGLEKDKNWTKLNSPSLATSRHHHASLPGSSISDDSDEGDVLRKYMLLLWQNNVPVSIEVLIMPDCRRSAVAHGRKNRRTTASNTAIEFSSLPSSDSLLLEQWTITVDRTSSTARSFSCFTGRDLYQAVRSHLHFSQLSAWLSSTGGKSPRNILYRLTVPDEAFATKFSTSPIQHDFPDAVLSSSTSIHVCVRSLPRSVEIPRIRCSCMLTQNISEKKLCAAKNRTRSMMQFAVDPNSDGKLLLGESLLDPPHKMRYLSSSRCESPNVEVPEHLLFNSGSSHLETENRDLNVFEAGSISLILPDDPSKCVSHVQNNFFKVFHSSALSSSLKINLIDNDDFLQSCHRLKGLKAQDSMANSSMCCHSSKISPKDFNSLTEATCCAGVFGQDDDGLLEGPGFTFDQLKSNSSLPVTNFCSSCKLLNCCDYNKKMRKLIMVDDEKSCVDAPLNKGGGVDNLCKSMSTSCIVMELPHSRKKMSLPEDNSPPIGDIDGIQNPQKLSNCIPVRKHEDVHLPTVPTSIEKNIFRKSFDSATSMVFHRRSGLPLTSSPAPHRKGQEKFDFDDSINTPNDIKRALFETGGQKIPCKKLKRNRSGGGGGVVNPTSNLLGTFEESVLNGRLEPTSTVEGFTAEIGASGSFHPKHTKLPVSVFFYSLCDNLTVSSPYLAHINLGRKGYKVPEKGTVQVTLFNPMGTVVKMFVVVYDLSDMPSNSQTFLRQRTLYMPSKNTYSDDHHLDTQKWLRYLIHLRFASSKSGKLYLHTDIRMIIFRKSDVDAASDHSDIGYSGIGFELRSFTRGPKNPKFSPKK